MKKEEKDNLSEKYSEMPENELLEMLSYGATEYEPEAYELLIAEAKKRGIENKIQNGQNPVKSIEEKTKKPSSLLIFTALWLTIGGTIFILAAFTMAHIVPHLIILGLIFLISAFGIVKAKSWAKDLSLYCSIITIIFLVWSVISIYIFGTAESKAYAFYAWFIAIPIIAFTLPIIVILLLPAVRKEFGNKDT